MSPAQVVTPAMQAGKEAHAVLEAEIALDSVDIPAETREDKFAVRLMNMDQKLRQLLQEGKTRELPVSGSIQVRNRPILWACDPSLMILSCMSRQWLVQAAKHMPYSWWKHADNLSPAPSASSKC